MRFISAELYCTLQVCWHKLQNLSAIATEGKSSTLRASIRCSSKWRRHALLGCIGREQTGQPLSQHHHGTMRTSTAHIRTPLLADFFYRQMPKSLNAVTSCLHRFSAVGVKKVSRNSIKTTKPMDQYQILSRWTGKPRN